MKFKTKIIQTDFLPPKNYFFENMTFWKITGFCFKMNQTVSNGHVYTAKGNLSK